MKSPSSLVPSVNGKMGSGCAARCFQIHQDGVISREEFLALVVQFPDKELRGV